MEKQATQIDNNFMYILITCFQRYGGAFWKKNIQAVKVPRQPRDTEVPSKYTGTEKFKKIANYKQHDNFSY
jgi:hypothetical protein